MNAIFIPAAASKPRSGIYDAPCATTFWDLLNQIDTRKAPCKTIPKMNRELHRHPQITINFCIIPWNNNLLRRTE